MLWAADIVPCFDFSDREFDQYLVGRWISEIGMAHYRLGRLFLAYNHLQVRDPTRIYGTSSDVKLGSEMTVFLSRVGDERRHEAKQLPGRICHV